MSLIAIALKYKKLDWYLLPIHQAKKQSLIKWAHRKHYRSSPIEVKRWHKKWPRFDQKINKELIYEYYF